MNLWVCSPFLGPQYAKILKEKANMGIDVRVLTSEVPENRLHQEALAILSGTSKRPPSAIALIIGGIVLIVLALAVGQAVLTLIGLLVLGVGAAMTSFRRRNVREDVNTKVKLQIARKFIHSKMYIADGDVAAVGSPNLTHGGLNRNFEHLEIYRGVDSVQHVIKSYMAAWNATA
jgi:phosphatidylserine/phosphatidylglycerophosphate/cardiolipin synthase-like enzyme